MKCALCHREDELEYNWRGFTICRPCDGLLEGNDQVLEPFRRKKTIWVNDLDYYIMKFGKHKGTNFEDMPSDYCKWYLNKKKDDKPNDAFHVYCILNYSNH